MDSSFSQMQKLLHAVWPAVSEIDWSQYCTKGVAPYDDNGVAKYTGLLLHRSGGGCIGASTEVVGFLPRPEMSAIIVATKTRLIDDNPGTFCSMQRRNPEENHWGGGIQSSGSTGQSDAITGLPEIGDHLLNAEMKISNGTLTKDDWEKLTRVDSPFMEPAREYVGMNPYKFADLHERLHAIVEDGMLML